jgi:hypothetical protein
MKKVLIGVILLLIGMVAYLAIFPKIPEGKILVNRAYLDSLTMVADLPPDTIEHIDTAWLKPDTIRIEKEPPVPNQEGEVLAYSDSLVTPDLTVWLWDRIRKDGIIENRQWAYRLNLPYYITREIITTKTLPMPYPVVRERKQGYSFYGQVGYDFIQGSLVGGGGIIQGRWMLGLEGGKNHFEVKTGILF